MKRYLLVISENILQKHENMVFKAIILQLMWRGGTTKTLEIQWLTLV